MFLLIADIARSSTALTASLAPRSPIADEIGTLWWLMFWLGAAVFALFLFLLLRGLFVRSGDGTRSETPWLLGGGVAVPVVGISVVFAFTLVAMAAIPNEAPKDSVVIEVVGHQWWWEVHYPGLEVIGANEVHIPVGEPVELHVTSVDVIHSFWAPDLGVKIDLLPDRTNTVVLEADETGVYRGACAEFCGLQHAKMRFVAVGHTADDFERWVEAAQQPAPLPQAEAAVEGLEVFLQSGCADCHTIEGTEATGDKGPDLTHIASRRSLAAGTLPNTPQDLRDWIAAPQTFKPGVEMPDIPLTQDELDALVAYLGSLE